MQHGIATVLAIPRHDVIGEHALQPATLMQIGELEAEISRRLHHAARAAGKGLPFAIAGKLTAAVDAMLSDGRLCYGTSGFDRCAKSISFLTHELWLLLKRHQPGVTIRQADELLASGDLPRIRRAVLECFGYSAGTTSGGRPPADEPVSWPKIVRALRKRGLSYRDIGQLTIAQLSAEFAPDEKGMTGVIEAMRRKVIYRWFEKVCCVHRLRRDQLAKVPLERAIVMLRSVGMNGEIDMKMVDRYIADYTITPPRLK